MEMALERIARQAAVVVLVSLVGSVDADNCTCTCCAGYRCSPTVVGHASTKEGCAIQYPTNCGVPYNGGNGVFSSGCSPPPTPPTGANSLPSEQNSLPSIDFSAVSYATTVPLGLIFLPIGLLTALLGYRLWKYVVFLMGFLFVGFIAGVIAWISASANGEADPEAMMLLAFLIGGACGGFCFIAMYFIVIFCAGCGFGMLVVSSVGMVFLGSSQALQSEGLGIVAVVGGIAMGFVFLKFQKVCIIVNTAYLGSTLTLYSIFYGFFHMFSEEAIVELLIYASTAIAVYIQWNYTATGVDVDPKTGQVTIVVVPGQPSFLGRIDQFTRLAPGGQPPQAMTTSIHWQQQQVVAPPTQGEPVWTQATLAQPLAQHQYQQQQLQQQQGLQAPLIQHGQPASPSLIVQNTSLPAAPTAGPMTLTEFCAQNKFGAFEVALSQLGVAEASELEDVTDEQLQAIGFNAIQLKRLRKQIPAASSADPTAPMTQTNAVTAVSQVVAGGAAAAEPEPEPEPLTAMLDKYIAADKQMRLGKGSDAAHGIKVLLGVSDAIIGTYLQQHEAAIEQEFAAHGTAEDQANYRCVLAGTRLPGWACPGVSVDSLLAHSSAQTAKLGRHHIIALRLYTTSSYSRINDPLRADPPQRPHPFAATTYFISDGIRLLRAVAATCADAYVERILWRGLKDVGITGQFMTEGGTDYACVSTTASQEVAVLNFAASSLPLVFRIVTKNCINRGADISFLSVYPNEQEFLYPPLTYLHCVKMERETLCGVQLLVATVEPTMV
eukprot:COSAG02_NODE_380_length_23483_cov_8.034382_2_plen_777_part_00